MVGDALEVEAVVSFFRSAEFDEAKSAFQGNPSAHDGVPRREVESKLVVYFHHGQVHDLFELFRINFLRQVPYIELAVDLSMLGEVHRRDALQPRLGFFERGGCRSDLSCGRQNCCFLVFFFRW
uniref:Uncharacterized protein n=1 Tax=Strombidium inclinatum TaxID=197538 RepID=A0A7S3IUY7_9SPIT